MSQGKIDEALWFESLVTPDPAPLQPLPEPEAPRRWLRFGRRAEESALGR